MIVSVRISSFGPSAQIRPSFIKTTREISGMMSWRLWVTMITPVPERAIFWSVERK